MKKYVLVLVLSLTQLLLGQVNNEILLKLDYNQLPSNIRIDNSGVYCLSHFNINEDIVSLYDFNNPVVHKYQNNNFVESVDINNPSGSERTYSHQNYLSLSKTGNGSDNYIYDFINGSIENEMGETFNIVTSHNELHISSDKMAAEKDFSLKFPSDLAYANLIGIDNEEFIFLIVERFRQQVPLKVSRHVYTIDNHGRVSSILDLPDVKFLYMLSDLRIDGDGNLYHLFSSQDGIEIIKWIGLKNTTAVNIKYPESYNYSFHFNQQLPDNEIKTLLKTSLITSASRTQALRIAEGYVYHKYECTSDNLAPTDVTGPDGDVVRTPSRLIVGDNARIPYKWGGFNTLSQFDQGLSNGRYAGDINTDGVSGYAVGVDCSGYVSRCWQLSYHSSTRHMPSITNLYSDWSQLKPGDAVHKIGHVRLYVSTHPNGSIKTVESTSARGWGVSYWSFAPSDLTEYSPRYYTGMASDYFENQPELLSVLESENDEVIIRWECDESEVQGYRLYRSPDRINWSLIEDESTLQEKFAVDVLSSGIYYYRVSSVKNNSPDFSESDLSNEMAIGKSGTSANIKYIIVDGFDRDNGSWRGDGHRFAGRYGKSLFKNEVNFETFKFESIKSKCLLESGINLNDYLVVIWIAGDESTTHETFSDYEQSLIINYLDDGGNLFVSGSEIGWDLFEKGSQSDREFYNNYLKAEYVSDDALSLVVRGVSDSFLQNCIFNIGQTYNEDYPDEIAPFGGSWLCMTYDNNKGAGIEYYGSFGDSTVTGKVVYLAFPLETTANDDEFDNLIMNVVEYFSVELTTVDDNNVTKPDYRLAQNYPNPFNPETTIEYSLVAYSEAVNSRQYSVSSKKNSESSIQNQVSSIQNQELVSVQLKVYDILGREVATLVNEQQQPGIYKINFDGSNLPSGIYIYRILTGSFSESRKMTLLN